METNDGKRDSDERMIKGIQNKDKYSKRYNDELREQFFKFTNQGNVQEVIRGACVHACMFFFLDGGRPCHFFALERENSCLSRPRELCLVEAGSFGVKCINEGMGGVP